MEDTETTRQVARSNSNSILKADGKTDAAASSAAPSTQKGEADEAAADSADVKDIMKLLVREAKKAAALAVEPTAST